MCRRQSRDARGARSQAGEEANPRTGLHRRKHEVCGKDAKREGRQDGGPWFYEAEEGYGQDRKAEGDDDEEGLNQYSVSVELLRRSAVVLCLQKEVSRALTITGSRKLIGLAMRPQ